MASNAEKQNRAARLAAMARGESLFMSVTPCKNGHFAPRETSNGQCKQCRDDQAARAKLRYRGVYTPALATVDITSGVRSHLRILGADGIEILVIQRRCEGRTVAEIADEIYGDYWQSGEGKVHHVLANQRRCLRYRDGVFGRDLGGEMRVGL